MTYIAPYIHIYVKVSNDLHCTLHSHICEMCQMTYIAPYIHIYVKVSNDLHCTLHSHICEGVK